MAVGVIWYPPIESHTYEAIREKVLQAGIDKGQHFHAAGQTDGRWCIIELWESRDGLEKFIREDLGPAFEPFGGGIPQPALVFDVHQYHQS